MEDLMEETICQYYVNLKCYNSNNTQLLYIQTQFDVVVCTSDENNMIERALETADLSLV